ncbi:unnamed protein product [Allacma fusca]|uniref:Uncharacterized protein n=1 Tax=Allacma fusca TaxID=39272 RepID=A0A8J2MBS9_9HEXA|nr:unnamed protein product [Allacma fusca]
MVALRASETMSDPEVIILAMRDMNIPRFTSDDSRIRSQKLPNVRTDYEAVNSTEQTKFGLKKLQEFYKDNDNIIPKILTKLGKNISAKNLIPVWRKSP